MADIQDRVITIYVRDNRNNLVQGASIIFFLNGVEAGKIDNSDGHATFQIPDRNAVVSVTAKYGNEPKTVKLAQTADSYEFRFDTAKDGMPDNDEPKIPSWFPAAAFGVGVFFVLVVLLLTTLVPNQLRTTYVIYRIVMSMGCAGFATALTGFIAIKMKFGAGILLMAGGSLAVFVIVYFWDPASNVGQTPPLGRDDTTRIDPHGSGEPRGGSASTTPSGPASVSDLHVQATDLLSTYSGAVCMVSKSNAIASCNHADMASCQEAYANAGAGSFKQNHRCLERPKTFYCFAYRSIDRLGSSRILDLNACFTGASDCDLARKQFRTIPGILVVAASCDTLPPP